MSGVPETEGVNDTDKPSVSLVVGAFLPLILRGWDGEDMMVKKRGYVEKKESYRLKFSPAWAGAVPHTHVTRDSPFQHTMTKFRPLQQLSRQEGATTEQQGVRDSKSLGPPPYIYPPAPDNGKRHYYLQR